MNIGIGCIQNSVLAGNSHFTQLQVIPLEKLRTEFKSFESRRQLCSSFDVFLADSRVYHNLHGILGKSFYARRK